MNDEIIDNRHRTTEKTVLNYEDATRQYTLENAKTHFKLHIEIEEPFIIKAITSLPPEIHRFSGINGTSIYLADINRKGRIKSFRQIRKAGLGLDETAEKIIRNLIVEPVYRLGINHESRVYIRIVFTGKDGL